MVASALPSFRSPESRLAVSLVAAVLLHALLLLLPPQRGMQPGAALLQLTVSLQRTKPPPVSTPAVVEADPVPAEPSPPRAPAGPAPARASPLVAAPASPEAVKKPPVISTAGLLDLAGRQEWDIDHPPENHRLGVLRPHALPQNWRSGLAREANLFDDAVAPEQVEIVDRWLAADGSHNVVINTPSGETYCGRAEAWLPTNPLYEPIMMWRPCGGGGKRTFQMPERTGRKAAEHD